MKSLRHYTFAACLLVGSASIANAGTSKENQDDYMQSQRCAGALSIMTAIGLQDDTLPIYKYFSDILDFHLSIFEYYTSQQGGVSMGDVMVATSNGALLVSQSAAKDQNSLQLTVKHCLSWINSVQIYFSSQKPGTPTSVVMAGIPRPSGYYDYPFSDWEPMIPLTKTAYDLWINAGMLDYHHCIASGQKKTIECMSQSN
jgi:hypothetical protein